MRHHNSVFHDLLKRVPWAAFERLVTAHEADKHVRRLSTKDQLVTLLYGQLSGASSLREIVGGLESHRARLYHVGARPAPRSTLADANARRPPEVFAGLFGEMVGRAQRGLRRKVAEATYLIDATSIHLGGTGSDWAHYASKPCGVKAHVIYDADDEQPIYAAITPARSSDIAAARAMPIEPGATVACPREGGGLRSRLLRLHLVGEPRRRRLPPCHPLQAPYAAPCHRGARGA